MSFDCPNCHAPLRMHFERAFLVMLPMGVVFLLLSWIATKSGQDWLIMPIGLFTLIAVIFSTWKFADLVSDWSS